MLGRLYKHGDWITPRLPFRRGNAVRRLYHDIYVPAEPETGRPVAFVCTDGMMKLGNGKYEMTQAVVPRVTMIPPEDN